MRLLERVRLKHNDCSSTSRMRADSLGRSDRGQVERQDGGKPHGWWLDQAASPITASPKRNDLKTPDVYVRSD